MVWVGIDLVSCTALVQIDRGRLTTQSLHYRHLKEHILPFAPFIAENLLQDNGRKHIAIIMRRY